MTRALRLAAATVAIVSLVSLIVANTAGPERLEIGDLAWNLPNIVVGFILTSRRPRLVTGWLFAAIGFLAGTGAAADALAVAGLERTDPSWWGVAGAWYGEWYWLPMIYVTLVFVPLVFPSAPPEGRLWTWVTRAAIATMSLSIAIAMLQERLDTPDDLTVANPIGVPGLADVEEGIAAVVLVSASLALLLMAMISLVVRFRRSTGVERQQLKWFTSAATALILGFIVQGVIDALFETRLPSLDVVLFALTPTAAGVAIMRYRLYAIDRIISRTVTYALVTALLVGVYVGAITLMSAAMGSIGGESSLAIATATLAAAALFRPARKAIQDRVDRRFNRARYDIERTLEQFRERVRNDVDLGRLGTDLVDVTNETLQPQRTLLWLHPTEQTP